LKPKLRLPSCVFIVAPYTGAWIETEMNNIAKSIPGGSPLHGGVD